MIHPNLLTTTPLRRAISVAAALLALFAASCGSIIVEGEPTGGSSQSTGAGASAGTSSSGAGGSAVGCGQGEVTVLASNQGQPYAIALDETNVYWGDWVSGEVMTLPKSGGTPTVVISGKGSIRAIAVDNTSVYWSLGAVDSIQNDIIQSPKSGAPKKHKLASLNQVVTRIAAAPDRVYWTSNEGLSSVLKSGGKPTLLAATDLGALGTFGVMLDESRVYWIAGVAVLSMPAPAGTPVFVDYATNNSFQIGMDEANLYEQGPEGLSVRPKSGGALVPIATAPTIAHMIAVNNECAYWSTFSLAANQQASIWAVKKSGGTALQVAVGTGPNLLLAADETGAYWSDRAAGTITRLAR